MSEELRAAAVTWWEEDPRRLEREQAAMHAVAPDLFWRSERSGGGSVTLPFGPSVDGGQRGCVRLLATGHSPWK